MLGVGCMVKGADFGVKDVGGGIWNVGFRVLSLGCRV